MQETIQNERRERKNKIREIDRDRERTIFCLGNAKVKCALTVSLGQQPQDTAVS